MSYEGFVQYWCRFGHYWATDVYYDNNKCPYCGYPPIFINNVNQTNCEGVLIEPIHLYNSTYEIPTEEQKIIAWLKHQEKCFGCGPIVYRELNNVEKRLVHQLGLNFV